MTNHTGIVPSWLTVDYVQEKLKNSEHFKDLQVHTLEVSPGSKLGDNYACQIFRLRLNATNNNKKDDFTIIGKYLPKIGLVETFENEFDIFKIEAHFFTETIPEIQKITSTNFTPLIYAVDNENKLILMEDLVAKNFSMQDSEKSKFLNKDECILAIEGLATLHGASYSIMENNPNLRKIYSKAFWTGQKNDAMDRVFENAQQALGKFVNNYGLPENHYNSLVKLVQNLRVDYCKVCDLQEGKFNTLLHGDCWKSNMMFKYEAGRATDVKLLDFQLPNYNSFANDLQYLIFSSVSVEVIVNDMDYILKKYYDKLATVAPNIPNLTFERIKREFSERYCFGSILSFVFRGQVLSDEAMDVVALFSGKFLELGFNKPKFISDIKMFMKFFEENGVI